MFGIIKVVKNRSKVSISRVISKQDNQ